MKLTLRTLVKRRTKSGMLVLTVIVLCVGALTYTGAAYLGRNTSLTVNSTGASQSTAKTTTPLSNSNSTQSGISQVTVPGSSAPTQGLQGGSGSGTPIKVPNCNICPVNGAESANTTTMCPEYACRVPNPTPTPTPPPHCAPCSGYRESGSTSAMYMCPMLCME
jgi:hypothetical protein